jgi:hypothetical protein
MKKLIAYVVKCGRFYANGARGWSRRQRRAFFFRWDGKPDEKWAKDHAKSLTTQGDLPLAWERGRSLPRVVRVVRSSKHKREKRETA